MLCSGFPRRVWPVAVVVAAWYRRQTETDLELRGGGAFHLLLVAGTIATGLLGIYTVLQQLGVKSG